MRHEVNTQARLSALALRFSASGLRICSSALILLSAGCLFDSDKVARGSVVENEVAGTLRTMEGPAVGARVRLYAADPASSPGASPVREGVTDTAGRFRFDSLPEGVYGVLGDHDTLLAFRDSILLTRAPGGGGIKISLPSDTLRPTGAIEVKVALNPGDDPASVTGELLGTAFNAHADPNGNLAMSGMPTGRLRLRFTSSLPGYQPLIVTLRVEPGKTASAGILTLPR